MNVKMTLYWEREWPETSIMDKGPHLVSYINKKYQNNKTGKTQRRFSLDKQQEKGETVLVFKPFFLHKNILAKSCN